MPIARRALTTWLSILALAAVARPAPAQTPAPLVTHRVEVDGRTRSYLLQLPRRRPDGPMPLVLAFHGGGGSGAQFSRDHGLRELAQREGVAIAFPDGVDHLWHDGYAFREREGMDDYAFVRALLADLRTRVRVDPARTYALGHSNGAFFTQALACRMPGTFAAIGTVAGQLAEGAVADCRTATPVSAVHVHGTADSLVPFEGGTWRLRGRRGPGAELLSAERSVAFRAERAGCDATPRTTREPDRIPDDGTTVRRMVWDGCAAGRGAELWIVDGGSHRWPGSSAAPRGKRRLARGGVPSMELDATRVIWEFFRAHPAQ